MQEIADRAGVNKALLHYYFKSKVGLARAVWVRIGSSFVPGVMQMLSSDLALEDKIDRFVDSYHTKLTRHPYLLVFALGESNRRPDIVEEFYTSERRQAARRMIEVLQRQIDQRAEVGKTEPVSAEQFFVTLVSSCLFPFAARPMLTDVLGLRPAEIQRFLKQRRKDLPVLLKRALRI
jgi:AcrR family transcriptional regulator